MFSEIWQWKNWWTEFTKGLYHDIIVKAYSVNEVLEGICVVDKWLKRWKFFTAQCLLWSTLEETPKYVLLCSSKESMDTIQAAIKQLDRFLIKTAIHPQIAVATKNGFANVKGMTIPTTCSPSDQEVRKAIEEQHLLGKFWKNFKCFYVFV